MNRSFSNNSFERQDIGYLLTAYADGQLAPEGVMWVEEQLDANSDLRAKLKEIRQLQAGLRTAFAGGAPAFVLDLPRRDALLASAANPKRKKLRFPTSLWIGLAASIMAVVYIGMPRYTIVEEYAELPPMRAMALSANAPAEGFQQETDALVQGQPTTSSFNGQRGATVTLDAGGRSYAGEGASAPAAAAFEPPITIYNGNQKHVVDVRDGKTETSDQQLARAKDALARNDPKAAEVAAWNVYESDRTNEEARKLYLDARRAGHGQFDDRYRETRLEKLARVHVEQHKNLTPQNEVLVHPEDWQVRALRKGVDTAADKPTPPGSPTPSGSAGPLATNAPITGVSTYGSVKDSAPSPAGGGGGGFYLNDHQGQVPQKPPDAKKADADRLDKEHKLLSESTREAHLPGLQLIPTPSPEEWAAQDHLAARKADAAPAAAKSAAPSAPPAPVVVGATRPANTVPANGETLKNKTMSFNGTVSLMPTAAAKRQAETKPAESRPDFDGDLAQKEGELLASADALVEVVLVEEKQSASDNTADLARGREEAVSASETGSTGAFMAVGAGGGSAGTFGNRNGGGKRRALAKYNKDADEFPVLKPVGGVAGQVGDGKPAQVEVAVTDPTVMPGSTVRITRNDLDVVDGKVVSLDNGRAVVEVNGQTWNEHGAKIKTGDVVSTIHPPGTQVRGDVRKSYRIVDLTKSMVSFPGPDLDIPEPGSAQLPAIASDEKAATDEFIEIIKKVVAPNSWGAGTAIEMYNGQMVVTNTADVQRQVEDLLITLRRQKGMRSLSQANDMVASMTFLRSDMTATLSEPMDSALAALGGGNVVFKITSAAESALFRHGNVDLRNEPVARGIVRLARSAGLQVRLQGGAVEIDAAQRPIAPDDAQGLDIKAFKDLFGTSPMQATAVDAIQTVAIDADTASYEYAKARVASGQPVDPTTIKPEHFINAMPMDYPAAQGPEAFTLFAEAAPSPFARAGTSWGPRTALVSIGAVAKPAAADERKPLALTLAIDCSGSMAQAGGLDRIQRGLLAFVEHLRAEDRVSIVAFGDQARVILPATPGNDRAALTNALVNLATGGATNAAEGLGLAYQLAAETAAVGIESRVLLATDGGTVAGADDLLRRVTAFKDRGITLVVVGTGATYRAGPLQDLATKGDGQHFYVGSDEDAQALFTGKLLPDRLAVLAKDAKLQVTWNPQRVSHARLIGYDQRRLAAKDFRDNTVDAGELSQDTQVTALFEVLLVDGGAGPLGTAAVRYKDMRREQVRELACPLPGTILQSQPSERLRLLACAAATAEWLQRGWWSNVHLITPQEIAAQLARCPQPIAAELRAMVK